MSKTKMILYASMGSLVSVLIWSLIGGCHSAPDKTEDVPRAEEPSVIEEEVEAVPDTAETMVEEEIITEDAGKAESPPEEAAETAVIEETEVSESHSEAVGGERIHTVAKGDTLWAISRKYGVSVQAIQEANSLADPGRLSIGQQLRIP